LNSRPLPYQGSALPLCYEGVLFLDGAGAGQMEGGAGDGIRTHDIQLGRLELYR
jgi:hypothetical protein